MNTYNQLRPSPKCFVDSAGAQSKYALNYQTAGCRDEEHMAYDVVIRNGLVVDGTGAEPVHADVALQGDRVAAVGQVEGSGHQEIDADGRLVTPGFVDVHTHLDAQIFWDPQVTSSCWHGVTSVVLGNCGVTFAPCAPTSREYLATMMEAVEDIPARAILEGMSWNWETYGDYLAELDRLPKGVNVGGMIGHCALRFYVMGERSIGEEPAGPEDIASMRELVAEALERGALGFSTSRSYLHRLPDGRPVPGTFATPDELLAIADVLGSHRRGTFAVVPRIGERDNEALDSSRAELAWMGDTARRSGRPLTFAIGQSNRRPGLYSWVMEQVSVARAAGADLRPQTMARGSGILFSLANRLPYDHLPQWAALVEHDLAGRLAVLRDPVRRAALVADAEAPASQGAFTAPRDPSTFYVMPPGDARYDLAPDDSLAAHAARRGRSAPDALIEIMLETEGAALLYYPVLNQDLGAVREMLAVPEVVVGVADAGAHIGLMMDCSQPTFFLTYWVRDEKYLSLAEGVRRLTSHAAQLFDLTGRGMLAPGAYADVNVIDLEAMRLPQPTFVHDFPHGAGRYVQRATGYDYTFVNGALFMEGGEPTGALAGTTLRSSGPE
jgi:N-acyl-D-aspartate/D-glutamate deacylase